jgi:hypothetical protein
MKKIKLYDYQQKMLEDIINVLTTAATGRFYDENGKKEKVGSSVMVQIDRYGKDLCDGGCGEMVP